MSKCIKYEDMISAYVDGELNAAEKAVLTAHLDTCQSCRNLFEVYKGFGELASENTVEPPAELLVNVMAGINILNVVKPTFKKRLTRMSVRYLAVAACIALTIMAVPRVLGGSPSGGSASLSTDIGSVICDTASGEEWTSNNAGAETDGNSFGTADAAKSAETGESGTAALTESDTSSNADSRAVLPGNTYAADTSTTDTQNVAGNSGGTTASVPEKSTNNGNTGSSGGSTSVSGASHLAVSSTGSKTNSSDTDSGSETVSIGNHEISTITEVENTADLTSLMYTALLSDSKYAGIITVTGALPEALSSSELYANGNGEYHIYIDKYIAGNLLRIGYKLTMNAAPQSDEFVVIYTSKA